MKLAEEGVKRVRTFYNRFTIDKLTKYTQRDLRNLPELISRYPGFGLKFKVYHISWKPDIRHFIIEHIKYKDNRHCDIFGVKFFQGQPETKIAKIKNTLKKGLWYYEVPEGEYTTDTNITYNIKNMERLIKAKKEMLHERNKLLGRTDYWKQKSLELKKKKLEDKKKKK